MAGDIYKARVDTVLPGMHAAFVNLGEGRNAFLYLADAKGAQGRAECRHTGPGDEGGEKGKGC